jgi:hypothetical protein
MSVGGSTFPCNLRDGIEGMSHTLAFLYPGKSPTVSFNKGLMNLRASLNVIINTKIELDYQEPQPVTLLTPVYFRNHFKITICTFRPPLWSSGQNSWLHIHRSGIDPRLYKFLREVMGLERGPLSLVSTIEELLERKSSGSGLENRD